jgi:hypothetical protein
MQRDASLGLFLGDLSNMHVALKFGSSNRFASVLYPEGTRP